MSNETKMLQICISSIQFILNWINSELKKRAYTFSDDSSSSEIAIRPDISQQIARIDQTNNSEDIKKYCYNA